MSESKDKNFKAKGEENKCISKINSLKTAKKRKVKKKNKTDDGLQNIENRDKEKFLCNLKKLTKGLTYISETDAEVTPFIGDLAKEVSIDNLFTQIKVSSNTEFEETKFEDFFRHPIKIQDWFNEKREARAKQYISLKNYLEKNLTDIKVFKVGKVDLEVFIVGLDSESNLIGIKTKATET